VRVAARLIADAYRGRLHHSGGYGDYTEEKLQELLDAEVEITGVAADNSTAKCKSLEINSTSPRPAGIKILKHAAASPWSLPLTPIDLVITNHHVTGTQRVRVHGTITYYQPGSSVVLQNGAKACGSQP